MVELERIPDDERRDEEELWADFEASHGLLLGAVFDVLSKAIAHKPTLKLSRRPRLSDWGGYAACVYEVMGWGAETFLEDWEAIVKVQNQATLDGSPVALAVVAFMKEKDEYAGSASTLHRELENVAESLNIDIKRDKAWPKSSRWLWRRIKEVMPVLAAVGIEAGRREVEKGTEITLRKTRKNDASDASNKETAIDKPKNPGINERTDASSNASQASNASSNASPDTDSYADSGNTGDTGNIFALSSEGAGPRALTRNETGIYDHPPDCACELCES